MGGPGVERIDASYGDPFRPEETEYVGGRSADGMDYEVLGGNSGDFRERRVPPQDLEVETRVVVDNAAEPPRTRARSRSRRRPRGLQTALRGQVVEFPAPAGLLRDSVP